MIIIPFIVAQIVLSQSSATGHRVLPKKIAPFFAVKSFEFPKIPETPPRAARFVHNECLWMIVCVPMIGRFMRRYAAHLTREWRIERHMNPSDAPLYDTFCHNLRRYTRH